MDYSWFLLPVGCNVKQIGKRLNVFVRKSPNALQLQFQTAVTPARYFVRVSGKCLRALDLGLAVTEVLDQCLLIPRLLSELRVLTPTMGRTLSSVSYTHLTLPTICSV